MKNVLSLSFVALAASAFAGAPSYKVNLPQETVISGKTLKAGQYKVSLENGNAILTQGKQSFEVAAHEEQAAKKADSNVLVYQDGQKLQEIRLGGTQTKIVFGDATTPKAGM